MCVPRTYNDSNIICRLFRKFGVIDTSNGLDGIAAVNDIKSVKDLKGKTIATNISNSYIFEQVM